jgi:MoxR-like ATPase
VIATQNPIEYHGTFPLPESQLDRFMVHIKLGYPAPEYEKHIVLEQSQFEVIESMEPVISATEIVKMQQEVDTVQIDESLLDYIMSIITETRRNEKIRLGVSPRGGQFLVKVARANAYYEGRDYVIPSDIKEPAPLVLGHRIILKTRTYISDAENIIKEIIDRVPVPV